jgi:hypothetical protein
MASRSAPRRSASTRLDLEQPRARGRAGRRLARRIVGATLGNDVNLRDVEGRSALLLGKAKDNNASAAIGPFVRLFDDAFGLDDVRAPRSAHRRRRRRVPTRRIEPDEPDQPRPGRSRRRHDRREPPISGRCGAVSSARCSRRSTDRDAPGQGFTHKPGDVVTIAGPRVRCAALDLRHGGADAQPGTAGPDLRPRHRRALRAQIPEHR